jgi:hypothetical protein
MQKSEIRTEPSANRGPRRGSPAGGQETGKTPTDRGKQGTKGRGNFSEAFTAFGERFNGSAYLGGANVR